MNCQNCKILLHAAKSAAVKAAVFAVLEAHPSEDFHKKSAGAWNQLKTDLEKVINEVESTEAGA